MIFIYGVITGAVISLATVYLLVKSKKAALERKLLIEEEILDVNLKEIQECVAFIHSMEERRNKC